jgi:aryl-alcohol dehydrogenase-like predicted oxidoreductase
MFDTVTYTISGGKNPAQFEQNVAAAALSPLDVGTIAAVEDVYNRRIRPLVNRGRPVSAA